MRLNKLFAVMTACCMLLALTSLSGQKFNRELLNEISREQLKERAKFLPELYEDGQVYRPGTQKAPYAPIQLRENEEDFPITESEDPESEVHAAINPKDEKNIIASAIQWSSSGLLPSLKLPIYYTKDFGETWGVSEFDISEGLPFLALIIGGGDPIIVFDKDGKAYFSWLTLVLDILDGGKTTMKLHWAVSEDGGATWKEVDAGIDEGQITGSFLDPETLGGRFVDKQWMASDANTGKLYTAYVEIQGENSDSIRYNILVKSKSLDESDFSTSTTVNPEAIVFAQFSSIDVDNSGKVHVTFAGATETDSTIHIFHSFSDDQGQTFSDPVSISQVHLPCFPPGLSDDCDIVGIDSSRMYPSPHVRVDKSGGVYNGQVYSVWAGDGFSQKSTAGVDIFFSRSKDGGRTWSAPIILNNDGNPSTHQFHPSICVNDDGVLIIGWYDRREDTLNVQTKYYMTYSLDGGDTFVDDFPVSSAASDFSKIGTVNANFGIGEYTQIIATKEYAIPFWADGRSNDGNIEIYYAMVSLDPSTTTPVKSIKPLKPGLALEELYPNPAEETTRLTFELAQASSVKIRISNMEGKTVSNVIQQNLSAGKHYYNLKLFGLAQGAYVVHIDSELGQASKKFIKR